MRTEEGPAFVGGGGAGAEAAEETWRLLTLPIRILGTRVWIFCPSTSTRARISESICTPLLAGATLVVPEVLIFEILRLVMGLAAGVRTAARFRAVAGNVLDRVSSDGAVLVVGDDTCAIRGWKPARWSIAARAADVMTSIVRGVAAVMIGGRALVGVAGGSNVCDSRTSTCNGVCVVSSSSSEHCEALEGAPDGGISTGARSSAALSCSLRISISSFASGESVGVNSGRRRARPH